MHLWRPSVISVRFVAEALCLLVESIASAMHGNSIRNAPCSAELNVRDALRAASPRPRMRRQRAGLADLPEQDGVDAALVTHQCGAAATRAFANLLAPSTPSSSVSGPAVI